MTRLRIVSIVPQFPKLSETFIVRKVLGLLERGHDVHVVAAASEAREWGYFPELERAGARDRVHLARPSRSWRELAKAPLGAVRFVRAGKHEGGGVLATMKSLALEAPVVALAPDIVHFEFGGLAVGREQLAARVGARLVVSFRGADIAMSGLETPSYYHQVWRRADAIHVLGQDLWRRARARGCPEDVVHACIPPAIEVERFAEVRRAPAEAIGTAQRPMRLLSIGRLHWKKGHEYTLDAVRRLRGRGLEVELRVLGDGNYLNVLSFACHQLGVKEVVQWLGGRAPEGVRAELAWADLLVHAAVQEGFCNAVIEAQAAGVPVVCSDAEGLAENVEAGTTGLVVPRRDAGALASAIEELARDPARRQAMGLAGRARASRMFRLADQLDAFEQLYQRARGDAN